MKRKSLTVLIISAIILAIFLIFFISLNKTSETVTFKHDKLYREYKESNSITGTPLPPTYETNKESQFLAETELYEISYAYPEDFNRGIFILYFTNKSTAETYSVELSGHYIDDIYYELITGDGYYNPYSNEYENSIFFEKNSDSEFALSMLCMSEIFISETVIPNVMTTNDFQRISEELDQTDESAYNEFCNLYPEYNPKQDPVLNLYAEDFISEAEIINGITVLRPYSGVPNYSSLDSKMHELGYTTEWKRKLEYELLSDATADIAMFKMVFNVENEIPKVEFVYDIISPKNAQVLNASFDTDYEDGLNEYIEKVFKN